eukprot:12565546-Alexandrium_andersonii.AAC.1
MPAKVPCYVLSELPVYTVPHSMPCRPAHLEHVVRNTRVRCCGIASIAHVHPPVLRLLLKGLFRAGSASTVNRCSLMGVCRVLCNVL